jgi:hypothetical protein
MLYVNGLDREAADIDSGDLERDLATVLSRRPPGEFDEARNRMMPTMIAYSAVHPEFGAAWRHRVMEPPRQDLKRILRRGIERGFFPRSLDLDLCMALLLGPILYNHIFASASRLSNEILGEQTAAVFCRAFVRSRGTP